MNNIVIAGALLDSSKDPLSVGDILVISVMILFIIVISIILYRIR